MQILQSYDELRRSTNHSDGVAIVLGRIIAGDGGHGTFILRDATSGEGDDGGTILGLSDRTVKWFRQYSGLADTKWFGPLEPNAAERRSGVERALNSPHVKAIFVDEGRHVAETLNVGKKSIFGLGSQSKIEFTGNSGHLLTNLNNDVTIRDVHLDGNYRGTIGQSHLIHLLSATNVLIDRVSFSRSIGDGVYIKGDAANITISNCVFDSIGRQSVAVVSGRNVTITNNRFYRTAYYHIDIEPNGNQTCENIVATDNTMTATSWMGAVVHDGSSNNHINNVVFARNILRQDNRYHFRGVSAEGSDPQTLVVDEPSYRQEMVRPGDFFRAMSVTDGGPTCTGQFLVVRHTGNALEVRKLEGGTGPLRKNVRICFGTSFAGFGTTGGTDRNAIAICDNYVHGLQQHAEGSSLKSGCGIIVTPTDGLNNCSVTGNSLIDLPVHGVFAPGFSGSHGIIENNTCYKINGNCIHANDES